MFAKIKRLSWPKKLLLAFAILFVVGVGGLTVVIAALIYWNHYDFVHRSGRADAETLAEEKKMWRCAVDIVKDYGKFYNANNDALAALLNNKDDQRREKDTAKLRRLAADHMKLLNKHRKNLIQTDKDDYIGYRIDALIIQAMCVRLCELTQMSDELHINADGHLKLRYNHELNSKLYQFYEGDNKHQTFKHHNKTFLDLEQRNLRNAVRWKFYSCGVEHGSFRLYQGDLYASVQRELSEVRESPLSDKNAQETMHDVDYSLLLLRDRKDSSCVAWTGIFRPTFTRVHFMNGKYLGQIAAKDMQRNKIGHIAFDSGLRYDFLAKPEPTHLMFSAIPYAELWKQAQYLALSTDNFLWAVKFSDKNQAGADKYLKYRVRPQYAKNSSEMQAQRDGLVTAQAICAKQTGLADLDNKKELAQLHAMPQAFAQMYSSSKKIVAAWDRYRQGQCSYNTFTAELRKGEAEFEKARLALLRERWDMVYAFSNELGRASHGYVICSLSYDGVNYAALERLAHEKQN